MEIRKVGVVGAGAMGSGIAQVMASAGLDVILTDVDEGRTAAGLATIRSSLARIVAKGKMTQQDADAALGRIRTEVRLEAHADREIVIEAATERTDLKLALFKALASIVGPETLLASNTSSISITKIAAVTANPGRVLGMHFFNPAPVMALVEVVRGIKTSQEAASAAEELARRAGKTPVNIRNSPGFAVNRILVPMINEAVFAYAEGVASASAIDEAMKLGANHPMGPLALGDLIGLDVVLAIMQVLQDGFGEPKYRPAPLLSEMVEAGLLGRKTGQGFFKY